MLIKKESSADNNSTANNVMMNTQVYSSQSSLPFELLNNYETLSAVSISTQLPMNILEPCHITPVVALSLETTHLIVLSLVDVYSSYDVYFTSGECDFVQKNGSTSYMDIPLNGWIFPLNGFPLNVISTNSSKILMMVDP